MKKIFCLLLALSLLCAGVALADTEITTDGGTGSTTVTYTVPEPGTEFVVIIIGGLFVAEALSVMIQVFYYKKTKKRIFLMAPLHHHFEKKGWSETKVVVRFWIVSGMLAACGFVLYFATTLGA